MATMAKVTCTRPGCGLACSSASVDEVMAWSDAHDQHCPSLKAQEIAPRLIAEAEKRGAIKALRGMANELAEQGQSGWAVRLQGQANRFESGEVDL